MKALLALYYTSEGISRSGEQSGHFLQLPLRGREFVGERHNVVYLLPVRRFAVTKTVDYFHLKQVTIVNYINRMAAIT